MEFDAMAISLLENQKKLRRAERLATLSKFASIVSHEIRNPLNSMAINMQILQRELQKKGGGSREKQDKYLNIVASEIDRLNTLVRNFLLIARPRELKLSACNVTSILEEVLLSQESRAQKQNVRILRDFHSGVNTCPADRDQLKQVFLNIVINAFEAMPTGGQLKVFTRSEILRTMTGGVEEPRERRCVEIVFKDSGVGIPKNERETIFDFYYSTKKGGTGLGLAIAQQIVEEHGGTLFVESEVGRGSTFTVTLPTERA
jgi:signal transduction histidine kinase